MAVDWVMVGRGRRACLTLSAPVVALVLRLRLGFVLLGRLGLELFSLGFLLVGGGRVVVGSWGRLVLGLPPMFSPRLREERL